MTAAFAVGPDVAHVEASGVVYVVRVPDGEILVLEGSAALIWALALEDAEAPLVRRVADVAGRPEDKLERDVQGFVDDLVSLGLLLPG